jgi:hypothetical protein
MKAPEREIFTAEWDRCGHLVSPEYRGDVKKRRRHHLHRHPKREVRVRLCTHPSQQLDSRGAL